VTRSRWLLLAVVLSASPTRAQVPHLAGSLMLDPDAGRFDGALCVSRFSPRAPVRFLLATGLNVAQVTDSAGRVLDYKWYYDVDPSGEGTEYVVSLPDTAARLSKLCVSYVGAFPVYDSNTASDDWKGRIAFTAGTVRATEQTKWYPVLYDSASNHMEQAVTYRLHVRCPGCRTIYVNGATPVRDTVADVASAVARPLMLYVGRYDGHQVDGFDYLGGAVGPTAARVLRRTFNEIKEYYERLLDVAYGDRPTLLSFRSVARERYIGRNTWAFTTWPTIAFDGGLDFDQLIDTTGRESLYVLSHEMAHYYFGTVLVPRGPLYWLYLESTADYLSLKAIGRFAGDSAMRARVADYLRQIQRTGSFPTLSAIRTEGEIDGTYRYRVGPLYLLALDRMMGERKAAGLLRELLTAPAERPADYPSFRQAALAAGITAAEFARFEAECLTPPAATSCIATLASTP